MVNYRLIAVAGFLASVNGLPLNINLGAYSPALVVGDGEISFGGNQDVTALLNALEGAAVTSATANGGATNGAANNDVAQDIQALGAPSKTAPAETTAVVAQDIQTAAATPEATPVVVDTPVQEQATPNTGIQGMGKAIEPREEQGQPKAKRDLAGFDRALTFAEAALTKGPLIQLGTGEGGAGVGIIVDNNAKATPAPAEGQAPAKRDETSSLRSRAKVTRMYIKRGIPAAIQNSPNFETRSVKTLPVLNIPALSKRDSGETIDSINLNIPGDEGVTMTFIETADDVDDDDEAPEAVAST
ncbi:hypothetical protein SAMD00023353_0902060 [Rosellinia necatrix]|uniref:CSEP0039 effector protein n=1 Tax=Rosellinia necatrix TaxID=77044 RepID=A0A1W2TLF2_ROSNE|nr:hypothetical protein SAMD00023353_0902060 [Rosellinia necatrix]